MSQVDPTSMRCNLGRGLTIERRIATALWNQEERERVIAVKAYEVFCSRGCEHGFDLEDWLRAEQELSPEPDDVLLTQSPAGFEISIAENTEGACIVLNMAPSNLLILWASGETDTNEQNRNIQHSRLNLVSLPAEANPEKVEVNFRDGRVWLYLPYVDKGDFGSERAAAELN